MHTRRGWWVGFALVAAVGAQDPARLDAHRITSGEFAPAPFGPVRWLDGTHYATLETKDGSGVPELVRYEAVSGERQVLVTAAMLWVEARGEALTIEDYAFAPDGASLLVFSDSERVWRQNTRGEYHVVPLDGKAAPWRLGGDLPKSSLMFAKWSPDGGRVAFVAQRDLWVQDVATKRVTRLTNDGSDTVINGTFDWVYEEEFDCRDGFRWSPDGTRIAYWQLDCEGVGTFYMVDNLSDRYAQIVPVQYPKAGTTNSACRVGVIAAAGGETVWMQTPGDPRETYLPRMEWHPDGKELAVQWLPRSQQELRVLGCDAATGEVRLVHAERDDAYVDVRDDFAWLDDGEWFFWTSDSAFAAAGEQQYRRFGQVYWDSRGKQMLVTAVPLVQGTEVIGVAWHDPGGRGEPAEVSAYMQVSADGIGQSLWPRRGPESDGKDPHGSGWHDYDISPDGSLAIHTYSRFDVPPVIDLVRLPSHERVRVLVDNATLRSRYDAVAKGQNEFFQVTTEPGVTLDGWTMYPPDFDPAKTWPVLFYVYGEPWAQTVKDTWFLNHHLFHRWLVQQGYVVMSVDARGTPAPKGRDWRKALYQKIGVLSSHDWNLAVQKLCAQHAWMDRSRLAIWGWSGGGAMTLNLLFRYPDLFCAGMSVAPVTDVALYDTIYQERYLGDPRQYPEVYEQCSPITFAKNLQGHLLLVHGTGDDNVHFQHSERLFDELVAQNKLFEYLAYPNRTHAIREGRNTREHLYASLADFLNRRVPPGAK
ncbi:MAG: DPP IV N-terminal domain-containing protein [Planctomycetes bacterium]|nr:DPP IV N-terminal domain-containing protein [Planctomycetota bacterium]